MYRTLKSIRRMLALILASLFIFTAFIGGALADEQHNDSQGQDRSVVPTGSMSVRMVKILNSGNAKKYAVYLELDSNVDISNFTLSTITISGTTTGGASFSLTKNNINKQITSLADYSFIIGYISTTSNASSASVTSSIGSMKTVDTNTWFSVPALYNASVTIQN